MPLWSACASQLSRSMSRCGAEHTDKHLGELVGTVQVRMTHTYQLDLLVLLFIKFACPTTIQPRSPCWRQTTFDTGLASKIKRGLTFSSRSEGNPIGGALFHLR